MKKFVTILILGIGLTIGVISASRAGVDQVNPEDWQGCYEDEIRVTVVTDPTQGEFCVPRDNLRKVGEFPY